MAEVTILTLPFDPLLEGFPAERLRDFLHGRELIELHPFPFLANGRPYWSLCLTTRRREGAPAEPAEVVEGAPAGASSVDVAARDAAFRELLSELSEHERVSYDRLRGWRRDAAHAEGKAVFMIAPNSALLELVRRRPRTKAGLSEVRGLGEKKVAAYGDAILEVLHGHAGRARREAPPGRPPLGGPDGVAPSEDEGLSEALAPDPGAPPSGGGAGRPPPAD